MLTDKEVIKMLQDYYCIRDKKIPDISEELINKQKEVDAIVESLTLSASKVSEELHGSGISKPVERIYEEKEKICKQYEERLKYIRIDLEEYNKKIRIYEKWLKETNITDEEQKLLEYMYGDGLKDWKIGQLIHCSKTTVWNYRKIALNKLKNMKTE